MAEATDFYTYQDKSAEALFWAVRALGDIDPDNLSVADRIAYAQSQARVGTGYALLAQIALQDQPPRM